MLGYLICIGQEGEVNVVEGRLNARCKVLIPWETAARIHDLGLRDGRLGDDVSILPLLCEIACKHIAI